MPVKINFNKENIDLYLNKLAEEYKKINESREKIRIILVGGASIIINYSFRQSTGDVDVFVPSFSLIEKAVKNTAETLKIGYKWLNDDFIKTNSFSEKLDSVSVFYKNIADVFEIRTVSSEYLVSMKLMIEREYKHDSSDIVGILNEHQKNGNPLKIEDIKNAVITLYGSLEKLPKESLEFINGIFECDNYEELYKRVIIRENEAKGLYKKLEENSLQDMVFTDHDSLVRKLKMILNSRYDGNNSLFKNIKKTDNNENINDDTDEEK